MRFREGNESCVHRFDCPGGGSFFAARCRVRCTHSLPQETSAGRNLITLFRTVNNSGNFFSGPASPAPAGNRRRRRRERATIARRASHRKLSNTLKAIFGAAFSASKFFSRAHASRCAHRDEARTSASRAPVRARRRRLREAPRFAPHKPICAKVRELFPPPRTPPATADASRTAASALSRALAVDGRDRLSHSAHRRAAHRRAHRPRPEAECSTHARERRKQGVFHQAPDRGAEATAACAAALADTRRARRGAVRVLVVRRSPDAAARRRRYGSSNRHRWRRAGARPPERPERVERVRSG